MADNENKGSEGAGQEQSDKRRLILQAAEKVFDANGYAATTIDAVAAQAGISKGSIYNYFKNKEDLFHQVFATAVASSEADIGKLIAQGTARQKLERFFDYWFGRLEFIRLIARLVLEFWATATRDKQGEFSKNMQENYHRHVSLIQGIIDEGLRTGEFSVKFNSRMASTLIMGLMDGIHIQMLLGVGIVITPELLAGIKTAVMSGLNVRGTGAAEKDAT
ncbi:MAG: TetR/AcrR family transcriptional regulator [Planctomycetes bacterium]|nr:TetR/AcrR family transcriptional regulator [Planctomycetota bacterium]